MLNCEYRINKMNFTEICTLVQVSEMKADVVESVVRRN